MKQLLFEDLQNTEKQAPGLSVIEDYLQKNLSRKQNGTLFSSDC